MRIVPSEYTRQGGIDVKITFAGKNREPAPDFFESAEKKLKKFDRYFDNASAQIKTDKRKDGETVELTIVASGTIYRSEKRADTAVSALDQTIEAILRQMRKNKTRLEKKVKDGAFKAQFDGEPAEAEPIEENPEFKVRTKSFPVKPMTVEDAILQMLLLEHDFFLFRDVETGALNVVYKKTDGDYGLIIPD